MSDIQEENHNLSDLIETLTPLVCVQMAGPSSRKSLLLISREPVLSS